MVVSMLKCYSVIDHPESIMPRKAVSCNMSPRDSATDLSNFESHHFLHNISSPSSSNESFDIIGDFDDNSPILRRKSRFQMQQRSCGEDIGFDVVLEGKETFKVQNMYYIRQGEYFSMGISFADALHEDLSDVYVRITPSWSVQRPEASTVIYCCNKHMKNSPTAQKLEQHSMLRIDPNIVGTYDIDGSSDRLTLLIPMTTKHRTAPFWFNLKSECFSTCGSSQKRSHHLITVTLERIRNNHKTVLGRKILHIKFSSSPCRDIKKCALQYMGPNELPKRCDFAKKPSSLHKVRRSPKSVRSVTDEPGPEHPQVTFLAVKKKYVERVKSYLKYLQNEDGDVESVGESDLCSLAPLSEGPSELESLCPSLPVSSDNLAWPQPLATCYAVSSISSPDSGGNAGADSAMDDLLSILEDNEPQPPTVLFHPGFEQPSNVSYSSFYLPEASAVISAPLVAQSIMH